MTRGEEIIRPDFSKNEEVKEIKLLFVGVFDKINSKISTNPEVNRLLHRSLEDIETAAMFAVKALTV